jgi:hypothetical protein
VAGATVWFDAERARFWRIPDDAALPAGPLTLHALTGARRHADPDALPPYALDREDARRAVVDELIGAARTAGRALGAVAHDVADRAASHLPSDATWELPRELSWAELEARLGPMTTWAGADRAREIVGQSADRVRATARRASDAVSRTTRLAATTARSAHAIGRVIAEHPELAETATRLAEAWIRSPRKPRRPRRGDPDKD